MAEHKTPEIKGRETVETLLLAVPIYSAEAVKLAAFVFSDRADIKIRRIKDSLAVAIRGGGQAAGEFMNEVLNQQCRIDLAKKNSKIAGIIVTKALLSAAGGK